MPAVLTTTSMPPKADRTVSKAVPIASSSATSPPTASARPPTALMAATVSSAFARLPAYWTATANPSRARRSATTRPMPPEPPVTRATRLLSGVLMGISWKSVRAL